MAARRAFPLFLAAVALAAVAARPGDAAAATACERSNRPVQANLATSNGSVRYITDRTETQIRKLSGNKTLPGHGWHQAGLTNLQTEFNLKVQVETRTVGPGRHCAALVAVDAFFGITKVDVYIERNLKPGSCRHRVVMEHENTHVALSRQVLGRYVPIMRAKLAEEAGRLGPIVVGSPQQAAEILIDRLRTRLEPTRLDFERAKEQANGTIDTPENYLRESKRCPGG
jgi:hypothetical protein